MKYFMQFQASPKWMYRVGHFRWVWMEATILSLISRKIKTPSISWSSQLCKNIFSRFHDQEMWALRATRLQTKPVILYMLVYRSTGKHSIFNRPQNLPRNKDQKKMDCWMEWLWMQDVKDSTCYWKPSKDTNHTDHHS